MAAQGDDGRLALNIMRFARALRAAGLPVGPGKVLDAVRAVEAVGLGRRDDFYWTLHSVFVNRRDQREVFDQAFHVFWRNPNILESMMGLDLPPEPGVSQPPSKSINRRVAEAMKKPGSEELVTREQDEVERDAAMTWSDRELLGAMDFERMSAAELARAKAVVRNLRFTLMEVPTRRFRGDPNGPRVDLRKTMRAALRSGLGGIPLQRRKRRTRQPPLVVLCDISGSMARYSRLILHFLHAISNDRSRVHTFLFGTRLTNVTRYLRHKDVDVALDKVTEAVPDWSGGTRIGAILHEFNRDWARRVLGQGAVLLFISDGLDRDAGEGLEREMERLHKSCRRLIWLSPLLRYEGFQPKSLGNRAIMPHVDEFRPVHNLDSLEELGAALGKAQAVDTGMGAWRRAAEHAAMPA
jgi:uncharacterized protein with von Willebrand factor type A (vWA) domain